MKHTKEQVNDLATELKHEVEAGGGPMLGMTASQELSGGPIADEIRDERAHGGGPVVDALQGTGLEDPDKVLEAAV